MFAQTAWTFSYRAVIIQSSLPTRVRQPDNVDSLYVNVDTSIVMNSVNPILPIFFSEFAIEFYDCITVALSKECSSLTLYG